jgi:hypothetical protein
MKGEKGWRGEGTKGKEGREKIEGTPSTSAYNNQSDDGTFKSCSNDNLCTI